MTRTSVHVIHDTSRPSRAITSYTVAIFPASEPYYDYGHPLRRHGNTWNGVSTYRGTYDSTQEAVAAAARILPVCAIVERWGGGTILRPLGIPNGRGDRVLGVRTERGFFIVAGPPTTPTGRPHTDASSAT